MEGHIGVSVQLYLGTETCNWVQQLSLGWSSHRTPRGNKVWKVKWPHQHSPPSERMSHWLTGYGCQLWRSWGWRRWRAIKWQTRWAAWVSTGIKRSPTTESDYPSENCFQIQAWITLSNVPLPSFYNKIHFRMAFEVSCILEGEDYPFDGHSCLFQIKSCKFIRKVKGPSEIMSC